MSGWTDWIFGNMPPQQPQPARPTSQGSLFGMAGSSIGALPAYQGMPNMQASVSDERFQPADQAYWMNHFISQYGDDGSYDPSGAGAYKQSTLGGRLGGSPLPINSAPLDPTTTVAPLVPNDDDGADAGYKPSFQPNYRPPYSGQAPYRASPVGPNLPRPGYNPNSDLQPIGAHLPIAPGDPGWTPPPGLSGPHNRAGDPDRPGYGRPSSSIDAASLVAALRQWGGWQ